MTLDQQEKINYRIYRSNETFLEAKTLVELGSWNGVINRLYYSLFYAVSALLEKGNIQVKTHSTQKSRYNELFILSGKIEKEKGGVYNALYNYRHTSDYHDFAIITQDEAQPLVVQAEILLNEIKKLINE